MLLTKIKGIGPKLAENFSKLGIQSVQDLLFHLPFRYQDRTQVSAIGQLRPGEYAQVEGVVSNQQILFGRKRSLLVRIKDDSGTTNLRFYHFNASQQKQLKSGAIVRCYGEARRGASGLEFYHPEYQILNSFDDDSLEQTLTPIYHTCDGITQQRLRMSLDTAIEMLRQGHIKIDELLPSNLLINAQNIDLLAGQQALPELKQALLYLHAPPTDANVFQLEEGQHPCQQRLIIEELIAHQLSVLQLRQQVKQLSALAVAHQQQLAQQLIQQLPFQPTDAQLRVSQEVISDLQQAHPMLRLVQGDVGSGKTLVAALGAANIVEAGWQAAIMAPTEILAEQHLLNFSQWFEPLGIPVFWLSGKVKGKARTEVLEQIANTSPALVIGTHALFQPEVKFAKLALAVIDEQHRFGVHQRLSLREKGLHNAQGQLQAPHQLIMTATPIPRTLAMSAYADLDVSVIDQMPPGRTPVNTIVISDQRRQEVVERVRDACQQQAQAYWVCTLIEESESMQCQAAEDTASELSRQLAPLRVGLIHGRLKAKEKASLMAQFKAHEIDLLVATTVIEVGVDVPNSSLMIIENSERLGLAQLHQLRGRVGRGAKASHCVLMYHAPLGEVSRQRLNVMRSSTDGFYIAEQDLAIRGPGELLGTRQTGLQQLKVADLERDQHLLPLVQQLSRQLLQIAPEQQAAIIDRWITDADQFAQV